MWIGVERQENPYGKFCYFHLLHIHRKMDNNLFCQNIQITIVVPPNATLAGVPKKKMHQKIT